MSGGAAAAQGIPTIATDVHTDPAEVYNAAASGAAGDHAHHKGNLQKRGQLVLILNRGARVHKPSLVTQCTVATDQHVVGHGLAEHFDVQSVGEDFLRLTVQIRMDEGNVVVAIKANTTKA